MKSGLSKFGGRLNLDGGVVGWPDGQTNTFELFPYIVNKTIIHIDTLFKWLHFNLKLET